MRPRSFRHLLTALATIGLLTFAPVKSTLAQDMAALVANSVRIDASGQLIAEGGVEVFYQGRTLRASRIVYDRAADRLTISGPIVLVDGDTVILVADQADLAADLTEGVLISARLVLNRELQLAANQIQRVGGRYTQLDNAVASSCKICADAAPLWEIRARRVIHDQEERQIYFDHAQFRVSGLPILYFPRLRMPDPTLARTSGFMMPQLRTTSGLGTGVKLPYFLTLGPHRDLTITPYLSTKSGRTVELRYRQAFATGEIEVNGALSRDRLVPGDTRHFLTAKGAFDLPRGFGLTFDGIIVSDPAYLLDYGLPAADRLTSRIEVSRTRRNEHLSGRLIGIRSIRAGEINSTLPTIITDFTYHRRFSGGPLGGEAGLQFQTHGHYRSSTDPTDPDGAAGPLPALGRDVSRASLRLDWRRNWELPMGIMASVLGEVTADAYKIGQDDSFGGGPSRLHGGAAMELRWPWAKSGAQGVGHLIEPVVQFVWAPKGTENLPNEDSILVEFDEGNLFSINRYPGSDATERGGRINVGLSYTRVDPAGWTLSTAVGRVFRTEDLGQFTVASGLDGRRSDWLAAAQLSLPMGMGITQRLLIDDDFKLTKSETRLALAGERYGVSGSYVFLTADPFEERPDDIAELAVDGSYKVNEVWTARAGARYDIEAKRANRAGLGLQFRNECVSLDLSLSRRFTSSTSVKPTTDFGLSVDLVGFGAGTGAGPSRSCRR
ncbi:MAG: LPS assembly protein LptD [Pseudotabrizicola sp.]|uniref:LPS-assembly protein LptD n=1 Tax=Pseudotabrizicola sp. TaxID=2939647 RepID=UPI002719EBB2|nr:LPS assembly protein LptD [Pseudotabrizicola sp.]MDO8885200.1 LPS assembly protein LptD [Pseudotabrizicola sp.]MDP2082787.1 LPS assembly protein LptD [Pseudotabrizicola sp.]MDZ7576240.1 LPS assembly protein LptD [Pseudotabrizicola sp.]